MKYFSMFSGIGGFELGLQNSDYEFECVGYSEVDKYAISIYERHFPNHKNFGDATKIRTEDLPDFDLLVGGFPCQAFSIAGQRRGFDDTRGTLFFEIARILRDKRPRYFLLENVRGLLSHDKGKTFKTILEVLSDLGYNVKWQVLNSKDFGVPQRRERVYIEGYLRGECGGEVLSVRENNEESTEAVDSSSKRDTIQLNTKYKTYQDGRIYSHNGLSIATNARGNNGWYTLSDKDEEDIKKHYSKEL
jgi:DNA (cytosine-5)-methyltransferase 1